MRNRRFAAAVIAVAFSTSGCSWAFMKKAPDPVRVPNYPVDCTSSTAAPVLDTICGAYFVANGIYWASQTSCNNEVFEPSCVDSGTKAAGIMLSAGLGAICAIAAASGYPKASRCQQVKELNALCITGDEESCEQLRPGWTSPPSDYHRSLAPQPTAPAAAAQSPSPSTEALDESR